MNRVNCPECQRVLLVPVGHEEAASTCPACGGVFVPANQTGQSSHAITEAVPPTALPAKRSRRNRVASTAPSSNEGSSRPFKQTYLVVVIGLFACVVLGLLVDLFPFEFIILVPLLAFPISVIVLLLRVLVQPAPRERRFPKAPWLPWVFVIGCLAGVGAIGLLMAFDKEPTLKKALVAMIVAAPISGVLFTVAAIWIVVFYQFLRTTARKIEKASKLDEQNHP